MTIIFLQEAQSEFLDAISHYEDDLPGLGRRFKDETDQRLFGFPIILSCID